MNLENVEDLYPLTPVQEGMLFHSLASSGEGVYLAQFSCLLGPDLDVEGFRKAWAELRHPPLRSLVLWDGLDRPVQVVRTRAEAPWMVEDWSSLPWDERERRWEELLALDRKRGFELDRAPLMRFALLRERRGWRFLWTFHHLILDGWSMLLVLREVLRGEAVCGLPFRDYVDWLIHREHHADEAYWRQALEGLDEPTPLGVDSLATGENGFGRLAFSLGEPLSGRLRDFARRHRLTLSTVFAGLWAVLLGRYSGRRRVLFGLTVSDRPPDLPGIDELVGMTLNTLPLSVDLPEQESCEGWLSRLQRDMARLRDHASTPLAEIKRWSHIPPGRPLFESLLVFESRALELELTEARYRDQSNYPLAVLVHPLDPIEVVLVHDRARLPGPVVERMGEHLRNLAHELVCQPHRPPAALSPLPAHERRRLEEWSPPREAPPPETAGDLLGGRPDAPALEHRSYAELEAQVESLAASLADRGVNPGDRVLVCLERSPEFVVALLAVMRAGALAVPASPEWPAERLALAAQGARLTLASESLPPRRAFQSRALPQSPAYAIYTSGSSGEPKAVVVSHAALAGSTRARERYYAEPVERFLLLSDTAFDSSLAGIFWTLATGGELLVFPPGFEQDLQAVQEIIASRAVTHTLCLPSLYALLLEEGNTAKLGSLRCVVVAGEVLPPELVRLHHRLLPHCALYNEYGPTEATVWCSVYRTTGLESASIPIGRPAPHSRLRLVDALGRQVPPGVPGELLVGGPCLAEGYLDRPELTEQRFLVLDGERFYKTGDRARLLPEGNLEFLGRLDDQVKIRGYRVEPAEVEAVLSSHPGVLEAAVCAADESGAQVETDTLLRLLARLGPAEAEAVLSEVESR